MFKRSAGGSIGKWSNDYWNITAYRKKNIGRVAEKLLEGYLRNLLGEEEWAFLGGQESRFVRLGALSSVLKFAADNLQGNGRRAFMAQIVDACGYGGQRWIEERLHWNRGTIRKGQQALRCGVPIADDFSKRGRKKIETHLEHLTSDIKNIADPVSQADPTFRTTQVYIPLTAKAVRKALIVEKGYADSDLPTERTILSKLNALGYRPKKVAKSKPKKKIPETDAIFDRVHLLNRQADRTNGTLRISMDAKAAIKVGLFSRGGQNRRGVRALDHDFKPDAVLSLFGFLLPAHNENHFYFSDSKVTADFIIDALESLWPSLEETYHPHTLVLNMDNGPENNSHRTQFIKRIVDFAHHHSVTVRLAYYPPYHSKYNPIERVWGILENHWNGELLDSVDKVLGLANTMTWNGCSPQIHMLEGEYSAGVKLSNAEMKEYESLLYRMPGLEKWSVDIQPSPN
jgi:hypothetical protein